MVWQKKGLIFVPDGTSEWMCSRAQVPTAFVKKDKIRIYFSSRNAQGKSLPSYIDVNPSNPTEIYYLHEDPILLLGDGFSADGIMPSSVVEDEGVVYLYYIGWNCNVENRPYENTTGLAVSKDGGSTFTKYSETAVLACTENDPYLAITPYVLKDGDNWHMWYGSGKPWLEIEGKLEPHYTIAHAFSHNGIDWERSNIECIKPLHPLEANVRPSIVKINDSFKMWFAYRDSEDFRGGEGSYRIGFAESRDGKRWLRDDNKAGIDVSPNGWDSAMITYPNIVKVNNRYIMFYNGDDFGQSGFGYAIWEGDM